MFEDCTKVSPHSSKSLRVSLNGMVIRLAALASNKNEEAVYDKWKALLTDLQQTLNDEYFRKMAQIRQVVKQIVFQKLSLHCPNNTLNESQFVSSKEYGSQIMEIQNKYKTINKNNPRSNFGEFAFSEH